MNKEKVSNSDSAKLQAFQRKAVLRGKILYKKYLNIIKTGSMSMRIRLFAFLSVFVLVMVLAVFIVLLLTGRISQDYSAPQRFIEKEFAYLHKNITRDLGDTVVHLVFLSQSLSRSIEFQLSEKQIPVALIAEHPESLSEILGNEINRLQLVLERTKCSGAFLVLDATVNPLLPNAEHSKAGFYIRRIEPDVPGSPEVQYAYYRGFAHIAHQNNLFLRAIWDMEFTVSDRDFFRVTTENSKNSDLPISKLMYWSLESVIPELNEPALLCSIPLVDSKGNTFGAAGFEISAWNFSVNYAPETEDYKNTLCLFGEVREKSFYIPGALVSGSSSAVGKIRNKESLSVSAEGKLKSYECKDGIAYMGLHKKVKMYSADSPYKDQNFALSLLMPKSDINEIIRGVRIRIIIIGMALFIVGIGLSFFISKRYLQPITFALDEIKMGHIGQTPKTKIAEIDGLLKYLAKLMKERKAEQIHADGIKAFEKLSYQELRITDLALRGSSYAEIANALNIKHNTVKWYLKEIYTKLGINSKWELFALAQKRA